MVLVEAHAAKMGFGLFHGVFGSHMLDVMREHIEALRPLEKQIGPLEQVMGRIKSLTDFDNNITAVTHGYGTALNSYRKTASVMVLNNITVPTLFVSSLDDPMLQ